MTDFSKGTINFNQVPASKVQPPASSREAKIFLDSDGVLKQMGFDGSVKPLSKEQTVKYYETKVESDSDQAVFTFSVPNPNKIVRELEVALKQLIDGNKQEALSNFEETLATLKSYQDSQNIANGIVDSDLREIENKLSDLISLVDTKVASSDFEAALSKLSGELVSLISNINNSLNLKATSSDLKKLESDLKKLIPVVPKIDIVADSSNVTIEKRNDTFGISVDVPSITKEITKQVGSGVSKKFVMDYVDSAVENISGGGTVATITSIDGSIKVTPIVDGYDIKVASSGTGGASNSIIDLGSRMNTDSVFDCGTRI
jgi:hypothetical protein